MWFPKSRGRFSLCLLLLHLPLPRSHFSFSPICTRRPLPAATQRSRTGNAACDPETNARPPRCRVTLLTRSASVKGVFFLVNKKPLWTEKEAGEILAVHLLKRKARKQASTHLTRVARLIVSYVCWIIGNRRLDPFVDNHRVTIREYFVLWSCKSSSRGIKRGSTLTRAANCEVNLQFLGYEILKSVAQWRSSLFVFIPAYLATCSVKHDNIDRRENLTISR